jgi:pyruvate/2-oxoglutarate dehydrogenase complex dihydrolipoamide dehydrogenase (E3) component
MSELRRLGVKIITGATVTGIGEEAVEIQKYESHELLPADTVIIATGSKPVCLPVGQLNEILFSIDRFSEGFKKTAPSRNDETPSTGRNPQGIPRK